MTVLTFNYVFNVVRVLCQNLSHSFLLLCKLLRHFLFLNYFRSYEREGEHNQSLSVRLMVNRSAVSHLIPISPEIEISRTIVSAILFTSRILRECK